MENITQPADDFSNALSGAEQAFDGTQTDRAGIAPAMNVENSEESSDASKKQSDNVEQKNINRSERNSLNAQKRINKTNQRLRDEIKHLKDKITQLENDKTPAGILEQKALQREVNTYENIVSSADAEEFENSAYSIFGDRTPEFMERTYKWAEHVNSNEPELRTYIERPYGKIMLNEWYKRMDNPNLRHQWFNMTSYEKGRVLDGFYNQLLTIAKGGATAGNKQTQNIPAATGGRNSNQVGPTDDFGIALQTAFNKFGVKR